jgi:hypothetical protein
MGRADGMPSVSTLAERYPRLIRRGAYKDARLVGDLEDTRGEVATFTAKVEVTLSTPGVTPNFQKWFETRSSDRVNPRQLHLSQKFGQIIIDEFVFKKDQIDVTTSWDSARRYIAGLTTTEVVFYVDAHRGMELMSHIARSRK